MLIGFWWGKRERDGTRANIREYFKMDHWKTREGADRFDLTQDGDKWQAVVNAVITCWCQKMRGIFLTSSEPVNFSRRTLPHWVRFLVDQLAIFLVNCCLFNDAVASIDYRCTTSNCRVTSRRKRLYPGVGAGTALKLPIRQGVYGRRRTCKNSNRIPTEHMARMLLLLQITPLKWYRSFDLSIT
jgi:hypothetical protein